MMDKRWNGKTLREILNISSVSEFFDWAPPEVYSGPSFIALILFGLFPVWIASKIVLHILLHGSEDSFDLLIAWNMELLDHHIFPLVALFSVPAYILALGGGGGPRRDKRSVRGALRRSPPLALYTLLFVWMCVNVLCVHGVTYEVVHGSGLKHESFLLHMEYWLCFFVLGALLRERSMKLWLFRVFTAVSVFLVPCAFYLQRYLLASPIYYDWYPSVACIFSNPNYYGYYLTVVIGLCAALYTFAEKRGWRVFYAAALVLNTVALVYNDTLGAWLGALAACVFLPSALRIRDGKWNRRALAALVIYSLVLSLTGLFNGSFFPSFSRLILDFFNVMFRPLEEETRFAGNRRWMLWIATVQLIIQRPLFGYGFEGISANDLIEFAHSPRPHNEFLQYTVFYGLPGGILYFAGCLAMYLRALKYRARLDNLTLAALTSAFGYLFGSLFGLTVYNTAPYLFIMLGLGYIHAAPEETTLSKTNASAAE